MKKIIIIGGGFAGLSCASRLSKYAAKMGLDIIVISDKKDFCFPPMLPDCLGRKIDPVNLTYDLCRISKKLKFQFIKDKVITLNLSRKEVLTENKALSYDFLVVASGSETNFYGNELIRKCAFKLDDAQDALAIQDAVKESDHSSYLISGGGYTGVEVATNLSRHLRKFGQSKKIVIIERAPSILGPLPQWMKDFVLNNLGRLNIEVLNNVSIVKTELNKIELSDGRIFNNSMLIWAAGVKTADFIQKLELEKTPQGRIKVNEYLEFDKNCFAAGDACNFTYKDISLRMAVQFAIMQGDCVAMNIIKNIKAKSEIKYRPLDLGYVIPMANNRSCGVIFGINVKGLLPTYLHYFMCIYRLYGFKNKLRIIMSLTKEVRND